MGPTPLSHAAHLPAPLVLHVLAHEKVFGAVADLQAAVEAIDDGLEGGGAAHAHKQVLVCALTQGQKGKGCRFSLACREGGGREGHLFASFLRAGRT